MTKAVWSLAVIALGCQVAESPAAKNPSPPRTAKPAHAAAPSAWNVAYRRACFGSITEPQVSPKGGVFVYCNAAFSLDGGEMLGRAPLGVLAMLDDTRVLSNPHSGSSMRLESLEGGVEPLEASSGRPEKYVVSKDGTRALGLEAKGNDFALVLRALPTLAERGRWRLETLASNDQIAFSASGRPLVLTSRRCHEEGCGKDCSRTVCDTRALLQANGSELVTLVDDVRFAAMARSGTRAIVVHGDGRRAVVELATGKEVVSLPKTDPEERTSFAIDDAGERVAYHDGSLRLARIDGNTLTQLPVEADVPSCFLSFAEQGHALFASCLGRVALLREGEKPTAEPERISFEPPPGYRKSKIYDEVQTFGELEDSSEIVWPDQIARFRSDEDAMDITVFAPDPSELARAKTIDEWTKLAMLRFDDDYMQPPKIDSWGERGARSLEYRVEIRDGCEPVDLYVRVTERKGVLYRVLLEVPPQTKPALVLPLLKRVFDEPLGGRPKERRLARTSPPPRSPC
jgi:hypothetical protein